MVPRGTLLTDLPTHVFFDLKDLWFADFFLKNFYVWEVLQSKYKEQWIQNNGKFNVSTLKRNQSLVLETAEINTAQGKALVQAGSYIVGDHIELKAGVVIEAGAWVKGPTILGPNTEVRHGAYVRGGVITGEHAVIGHTTEVKSSIFLNHAKAAHFAYVGDSILGNHVNLGAGTKLSNLKMTNDEVVLRIQNEMIHTKCRKFGALVGDHTEIGCNSVLNPGVLLGKKSMVYACVSVKNQYYPPESRIK